MRRSSWIGGLLVAAIALLAPASRADDYTTRVIAQNLNKPHGIVVAGWGAFTRIYFTEVPSPGVPGADNAVKVYLPYFHHLLITLHQGEPEPVNITRDSNGQLYWTCRSAGVILTRDPSGNVSHWLDNLEQPNGITVGPDGYIYFTELPTPGVPGSMGGTNRVSRSDGTNTMVLDEGDPEPTDIAVSQDGTAYWTCKSAGVIVRRVADGQTDVLLHGLNKPVGIAIDRQNENLYFTEVPTPGVPGSMGGGNFVWKVNLATLERTIVHFGDPEPTDVTVGPTGIVYWTCTSAGVIVEARPRHMHQPGGPSGADFPEMLPGVNDGPSLSTNMLGAGVSAP